MSSEAGATVAKDQTFDIAAIAPGSYTLNLLARAGDLDNLGHLEIEVGPADLNDVQLQVVTPSTVRGEARFEGTPLPDAVNANKGRVFLGWAELSGVMAMGGPVTPIRDDNTFD